MKYVAALLVLALVAGCASPTKSSSQIPSPVLPGSSSPSTSDTGSQSQSAPRTATIQIGGAPFTVSIPDGASDAIVAQKTDAGVVWAAPQRQQGEGVQMHPTEPPTLWLTPFRATGGSLEEGRRQLFTFPLKVPLPATGEDQYVQVSTIAPAGGWVAVMLSLHLPGAVNGSGRLDVVNLQTGDHGVITEAHMNGGEHFFWRAVPGQVYWEQQSLTATGEPKVVASKAIDLDTGKVSDTPPGTAKQK